MFSFIKNLKKKLVKPSINEIRIGVAFLTKFMEYQIYIVRGKDGLKEDDYNIVLGGYIFGLCSAWIKTLGMSFKDDGFYLTLKVFHNVLGEEKGQLLFDEIFEYTLKNGLTEQSKAGGRDFHLISEDFKSSYLKDNL